MIESPPSLAHININTFVLSDLFKHLHITGKANAIMLRPTHKLQLYLSFFCTQTHRSVFIASQFNIFFHAHTNFSIPALVYLRCYIRALAAQTPFGFHL